jgi:primosomal protein N' (replication factor Y)
MKEKFYTVAIDAPLWPDQLTYRSADDYTIGEIVQVPLGKRKSKGVITDIRSEGPINSKFEIKTIEEKVITWGNLQEAELQLYQWTAKYYQYPIGKFIFDCLPSPTKKIQTAGPVIFEKKEWKLKNTHEIEQSITRLAQVSLIQFSQHLIHGVTGSGKSLVYIQWIKKILLKQKSVLYLVPEINLTPQFVEFFSQYLDVPVYHYHSQISEGKRFALYHKLKKDNDPIVVISARSGVFLPSHNWGAIIVDEEHDQSYKQDDRCRYHARDVAIYKAKLHNIPILMGSATPSLETYFRFTTQEALKNNYYQLKERYHQQNMPVVLKLSEPHYTESHWPLSQDVILAIRETLSQGGQILIFVNKLGFSRYVQCKSCHQDFYCPNCSVKLTYFKNRQTIECRQCDFKQSIPKSCPKCGCLDLWAQGFGVEKVVEKLNEYFSGEKILRIDRDEAKTLNSAQERFAAFEKEEYKILVGTQMVTKGHNFKNVKLVVVLGIDSQLHSADFRAKEKIFQLLNQVAGRAGRTGGESRIFVQSNMSQADLDLLMTQNTEKFYKDELAIRKIVNYPPYRKMVQVVIRGASSTEVHRAITSISAKIEKTIKENVLSIQIKGPRPSVLEKIKNQYGETLILVSDQAEVFSKLLKPLLVESKQLKKLDLVVNVDPQFIE